MTDIPTLQPPMDFEDFELELAIRSGEIPSLAGYRPSFVEVTGHDLPDFCEVRFEWEVIPDHGFRPDPSLRIGSLAIVRRTSQGVTDAISAVWRSLRTRGLSHVRTNEHRRIICPRCGHSVHPRDYLKNIGAGRCGYWCRPGRD